MSEPIPEVFETQLLHEHLDLSQFDSGQPALDDWLRNEAVKAQKADVARVHAWTRPGSDEVVAYFALVPTLVSPSTLPRSARGPYSRSDVVGYLIGRLALARSLQHQGLGFDLLVDACGTAAAASQKAGGRVIVVDAIDDSALGFYRHYGFKPIDKSNRLYVLVADFVKTYGEVLYGPPGSPPSTGAAAVYKI